MGKTAILKVTRIKQGHYSVNFSVGEPGTRKIVVKFQSDDKWEEVCDQTVNFSDISRGGFVEKVPHETVKLNSLVSFMIQSVDGLGTKIGTGGDHWQTIVSGPGKVNHNVVTDHRDGTYKCELKFTERGTYNVQVVLEEEEAKGSPIKFVVI